MVPRGTGRLPGGRPDPPEGLQEAARTSPGRPKTAPGPPQDGPRPPPGGLPDGPRTPPGRPKTLPGGLPDPPKRPPRWPKTALRGSQTYPRASPRRPKPAKTLPRRFKMAPGGLRRPKTVPKWLPNGSKIFRNASKDAPKTPQGSLNSGFGGAAVLPALRARSAAPPAGARRVAGQERPGGPPGAPRRLQDVLRHSKTAPRRLQVGSKTL